MEKIGIKAKDGTTISALFFSSENAETKGVVVLCHGFGEHAGLYTDVAERLAQAGYASILYDQRGHGKPPDGNKKWFGVISGYECFLDDVDSVANAAGEMQPGIPMALYGHSMGGNIAISALLRGTDEFKCAVLEAPWLGLYKKQSPLIVGFAKVAGRISEGLTTINKLNPHALTADPERAKLYVDDPLYHGRISFRMFTGINDACVNVLANAGKMTIPTFLAYAHNDKVLDNSAILRFAADAGDIITLHEYDCRHAIHNDLKRDDYFNDVIAFLDEHCKN